MNPHPDTAACLETFTRYVAERNIALREHYITLLAEDLSRQQWQGCLQRNVLIALQQMYEDAVTQLQSLPFDASEIPVNKGMCELTQQVLSAFQGSSDDFLLFVVDQHRTSSALSNFPDEHKPDQAYVNEVRREMSKLWKDFALSVNDYLCAQSH